MAKRSRKMPKEVLAKFKAKEKATKAKSGKAKKSK